MYEIQFILWILKESDLVASYRYYLSYYWTIQWVSLRHFPAGKNSFHSQEEVGYNEDTRECGRQFFLPLQLPKYFPFGSEESPLFSRTAFRKHKSKMKSRTEFYWKTKWIQTILPFHNTNAMAQTWGTFVGEGGPMLGAQNYVPHDECKHEEYTNFIIQ